MLTKFIQWIIILLLSFAYQVSGEILVPSMRNTGIIVMLSFILLYQIFILNRLKSKFNGGNKQ